MRAGPRPKRSDYAGRVGVHACRLPPKNKIENASRNRAFPTKPILHSLRLQ